ncbi:hypothetical protein L5515_006031 [Caenorhabditis briggsae]|uniref:T20D4.11-like domain-containing protein n=1 Tax=Caenorhabditis briggsae TaxID=6238 RepID=A0AAE9EUX6_CAEBR|nr:hypothetical protein L5515_006031 [Caenorhabditis briggsae]
MFCSCSVSTSILIFLACVLFGLVFGYDGSECNPADWYIAVKCSIKHGELLSQAKILDLKNDYNMRKINMTCTDFLKCSTQFKCGTKKDVEEIDKAVFVCNFVAFLISPGFVDCVDKVDSKKSTCLQEWDPFPDLEGTEEENKVKQKEACRNFLAKTTKHKELRSQGVTLDLDYVKNMTKLNKTCEDFLECSTQFKCGGTTKDVENIDEAVSYCHVVAFHVSPGYLDYFEGTEEEKMRKQKEACRNFFGKDGCLEKEISDMCSVELWKDFRKHYLALNKIIEASDFD